MRGWWSMRLKAGYRNGILQLITSANGGAAVTLTASILWFQGWKDTIAVWTRDVCECLDLHLSHTELKSFHIHHLLFWILSLTSKLNFHFVFASLFCHHFVVQLLCCLNHCSEWHICPNNIVFGQHGSWWEFLGTVNLMFFTVKVGQI